ncbi:MAG: acyl-CoA thioester hydrolase [Bermanella sp.]|jgi:acyl-CoA thioester hydrolase
MSDNKSTFQRDYPLILKQNVIWGDMDAFQHVNNTVYFRYFEDARMAYFEKTGVMEYMDKTNLGPILAETDCQFKAPISFPDNLILGARLLEIPNIGDKRFTMEYAVYSERHGIVAAKGKGLIVYYNYDKKISCEVPESLIQAFKQLQNKDKH